MQIPLNTAFALDVVEKPDPADRKEQRGSEKYKMLQAVRYQWANGEGMHSDDVEKIGDRNC